jgi:tetratricopeptide (TPR) repeat protein
MTIFAAKWIFLAAAAASAGAPVALTPDLAYTTRDPAAVAMHPGPGNKAQFRRNLDAALRANPRDANALLHRAYLHYAGGHAQEGERDFQRALALAESGSEAHRRTLWSWGWSLFQAGEPARALEKWNASAAQAPAPPSWLPYTVALAHWKLDHRAEAMAWFAAAVRSDPRWASAEGRSERSAGWRDEEQAVLADLAAAWAEATTAAPR